MGREVILEEKLLIRTSVHGPVVGQVDGADVALRVVGLDSPGLFEQYWEMSTATNLQEFEAAQRKMQMPMLTVMYADRDGHIGGHGRHSGRDDHTARRAEVETTT